MRLLRRRFAVPGLALTAGFALLRRGEAQPPSFPDARKAADAILSQPEFRTVVEQSAIESWLGRAAQWILQLLTRLAGLGRGSPWIATVLEWSLFALAAGALLAWGFRRLQRQQLAVMLAPREAEAAWRTESDNWAERSRTQAADGQWREAVHSLYWATIVMLEGRKLWRSNRARTPREYLQLLEPGSARQQTLSGLTRLFERIWYGQRPASETDYDRAQTLFEELRGA